LPSSVAEVTALAVPLLQPGSRRASKGRTVTQIMVVLFVYATIDTLLSREVERKVEQSYDVLQGSLSILGAASS